jgi:hypothetical protein
MDLEPRLVKRYEQLVRSHMVNSDFLSAGVKSTLNKNAAFAETQGAWRFLNNDKCTLQELIKPIQKSGLEEVRKRCVEHVLIAHDWSGLSYKTHKSKQDRLGVHNEKDLGYELQSSLLLNDQTGSPLAPIALNVATKNKLLSTYKESMSKTETHLEELAGRIAYLESCGIEKPLIHIVDREADSIQLMRDMGNYKWLFRSRSNSRVVYEGGTERVDELAKKLSYNLSREINYKGQKAIQYISEAEVIVDRIAQPKKRLNGKKQRIKGEAIKSRLVISKVQDKQGKVLAWWYLLTNVTTVSMDVIALWYYWRWSIESFFKLLKSAGMQLETWQQESGEATARRLLIACMACICVWQIAELEGPEASELRTVLIRLSGRQMKYGVAFTRPALLAGLSSLLNTLDLLDNYNVEELKHLLKSTIGSLLV